MPRAPIAWWPIWGLSRASPTPSHRRGPAERPALNRLGPVLVIGAIGCAALLPACGQSGAPSLEWPFDSTSGSAQIFAPGNVSLPGDDMMAAFAATDSMVYLARRAQPGTPFHLVALKWDGRAWGPPATLPFSAGSSSDQSPAVSENGRCLVFSSDRGGVDSGGAVDLFRTCRVGVGWQVPVNLGPEINSASDDRDPTIGSDGTLYFWSTRPGGRGNSDLYRASFDGTGFGAAEPYGDSLNTALWESSVVVAPDGAFVVFGIDDRSDGLGAADLYISYRSATGFSSPRNLGALVNTPAFEFAPRFSPDGRFLTWSSNREGQHQVYYVPVSTLMAHLAAAR